jgi:hypothetical protein
MLGSSIKYESCPFSSNSLDSSRAQKLNFDWKELSTEFPLFRKVCLKYEARRLEFNVGIGGRNLSIYEKHLAISSFS